MRGLMALRHVALVAGGLVLAGCALPQQNAGPSTEQVPTQLRNSGSLQTGGEPHVQVLPGHSNAFAAIMPDGSALRISHGQSWCRINPSGSTFERSYWTAWAKQLGSDSRLLLALVPCASYQAIRDGRAMPVVNARLLHGDPRRSVPFRIPRTEVLRGLQDLVTRGVDIQAAIIQTNRSLQGLDSGARAHSGEVGIYGRDDNALYLAGLMTYFDDTSGTRIRSDSAEVAAISSVRGWGVGWLVHRPHTGDISVFEANLADARALIEDLIRQNPDLLRPAAPPGLPPGVVPVPQRPSLPR
jgi:hypothetical protein